MALRRSNPSPRNVALGGALAGGLIAFALTENATAVVVGTVLGLVIAPLAAGASPRELHDALWRPAKRS